MPHNVLITGGAGFIGRWLVDRCLKHGRAVVGYDKFSFGRPDNLTEFSGRIVVYAANVLDSANVAAGVGPLSIGTPHHLAADPSTLFSSDYPLPTRVSRAVLGFEEPAATET